MAVRASAERCDPTTPANVWLQFHRSADPNDYPANVALPTGRPRSSHRWGRRRRSMLFGQAAFTSFYQMAAVAAGDVAGLLRFQPHSRDRIRRRRRWNSLWTCGCRLGGRRVDRQSLDGVADSRRSELNDCSTKRYAAYSCRQFDLCAKRGATISTSVCASRLRRLDRRRVARSRRDCAARRRKAGARRWQTKARRDCALGAFGSGCASGNLFALGAAVATGR